MNIDERHRKEILRFLLLKTAAVRGGIKPGELLRVRHCYKSRNPEGFQFCLYRNDILRILQLHYLELRVEQNSSLVLFYHPETLAETLSVRENQEVLNRCGYPESGGMEAMLDRLLKRFSEEKFPHEIGIFIGYPAKDVSGFIANLPRTPVHKGAWAVFGDASESVRRMRFYLNAEGVAEKILNGCNDLQTFYKLTSNLNITKGVWQNG